MSFNDHPEGYSGSGWDEVELAKLKAELAANSYAHANFEQDIEHLTA